MHRACPRRWAQLHRSVTPHPHSIATCLNPPASWVVVPTGQAHPSATVLEPSASTGGHSQPIRVKPTSENITLSVWIGEKSVFLYQIFPSVNMVQSFIYLGH